MTGAPIPIVRPECAPTLMGSPESLGVAGAHGIAGDHGFAGSVGSAQSAGPLQPLAPATKLGTRTSWGRQGAWGSWRRRAPCWALSKNTTYRPLDLHKSSANNADPRCRVCAPTATERFRAQRGAATAAPPPWRGCSCAAAPHSGSSTSSFDLGGAPEPNPGAKGMALYA